MKTYEFALLAVTSKDELSEDTTGGLDTKGGRADVDENNVLSAEFTRDTILACSTVRDSLI